MVEAVVGGLWSWPKYLTVRSEAQSEARSVDNSNAPKSIVTMNTTASAALAVAMSCGLPGVLRELALERERHAVERERLAMAYEDLYARVVVDTNPEMLDEVAWWNAAMTVEREDERRWQAFVQELEASRRVRPRIE